jgi:hypothetical protein
MTDSIEGTEQGAAKSPLAADVISSEPDDPIAAAARVVEQLKARRVSLLDRIQVNERSAAARAFDAFTGNRKALKEVADWDEEAVRLARERSHLDAALTEAERRHREAIAAEAVKQERGRAELARERFATFARVAQAYSDQIDGLVQLYGELQEAARLVHETHFGPNERQVLHWAQRLVCFKCQDDRNLRFQDPLADGRERRWLISAPKDWYEKLMNDTAPLIEPAAQAAE